MKISVVIAAYNEAENIGPLTSRLISTLGAVNDTSWELIYVIEGTDDTRAIAETFACQHQEVRILYNPEPRGLANAFRKGFSAVAADADVVVTMDADLNHQPEEIPRLVSALFARNADIVVGSRKVRGSTATGTPFWKRTLSDGFNRSMRALIGMPVADMTSGYRVYRAEIVAQISFDNTGFAFLPEILMRAQAASHRIVEEPIQFIFRVAGDSKMRLLPTMVSYANLLASRFLSGWNIAAASIMIAAVIIRFLLAYPVHKFHADADATLAGLCGINVLHGNHPVFFPGGYRLGAQSCYVTAVSFLLFGISRGSLALTGIFFSTLIVVFMYLYLREAYGSRASLAGLLLVAIPPLQIVINTYVAWAYGEILMYCASTLWLATLITRQTIQSVWFFLLGISAGLALWCSAQSLMVTLPIAVWLLLRRVLNSRVNIVLMAAGLLVGTSPLWMFAARGGLSKMLGEGSAHPVNSVAQLTANTSYLILHLIPWLLVDRQGSELSLQSGTATLMLAYAIGALILLCLAIWPNSILRQRPDLSAQTVLLGMILLCCAGVFVLSGAGAIRGWTVRYILPLYLVVPGIAAILCAVVKKGGQIIGITSVIFLLFMNVREYPLGATPLRRSLRDSLMADEQFIHWLKQEHIQAVLGGYWDVYSLNFDSKGAVEGIPVSRQDDYFGFGDDIGARKLRWALVDETPSHLMQWEHQLNIRGEMFPLGINRFLFVPDTNPPGKADVFLSLARASAPP